MAVQYDNSLDTYNAEANEVKKRAVQMLGHSKLPGILYMGNVPLREVVAQTLNALVERNEREQFLLRAGW